MQDGSEQGSSTVEDIRTQGGAQALQEQFDLVRAWLAGLEPSRVFPPVEATAQMLRTLADLASAQDLASADQTARSMASFMEGMRAETMDHHDHQQLLLMLGSLRKQLHLADPVEVVAGPRPAAAGAQGDNLRISLYLETPALAESLLAILDEAGFQPSDLASMAALARCGEADYPAAVVADLTRCLADADTLAAVRAVRARFDPPLPLFCLMDSDSPERRVQAVRLGATHFVARPVDPTLLVESLNNATARGDATPLRVLFIDDDPTLTRFYLLAMETAGVEAESCNDPTRALAQARAFRPDVIVTDLYMPRCNGLELTSLLRQDPAFVDTPLLFLSSETDLPRQMAALEVGADDFLTKPVKMQVLHATVIARAQHARRQNQYRAAAQPNLTPFGWSARA